LYNSLNEFCKEGHYFVWIDRLSIDQSNVLERKHQVHLMGRISNMSDSVIVWLGCSQWYLDAARRFKYAEMVGTVFGLETLRGRVSPAFIPAAL
jgi:hypothetical protein